MHLASFAGVRFNQRLTHAFELKLMEIKSITAIWSRKKGWVSELPFGP